MSTPMFILIHVLNVAISLIERQIGHPLQPNDSSLAIPTNSSSNIPNNPATPIDNYPTSSGLHIPIRAQVIFISTTEALNNGKYVAYRYGTSISPTTTSIRRFGFG